MDDDGEEEGSVVAGVEDDSLSEGSAISDADDDADAEGSDTSDVNTPERRLNEPKADTNGLPKAANGSVNQAAVPVKKPSGTAAMTDTEAMMNGLNIAGDMDAAEGEEFDNMTEQPQKPDQQDNSAQNQEPAGRSETLADRRRREHEEYKKKRDADPAFVPNRGGFFMHDHRSAAPGQNGFRPFGRGRGRGRGGLGGPTVPTRSVHTSGPTVLTSDKVTKLYNSQGYPASGPADAQWAHDLHETVVQPEPVSTGVPITTVNSSSISQPKPAPSAPKAPPPNRSFSKSIYIGNVQVRVYMAGMQDPIVFSAVPVNQHTRLPHHRPPLRRDKPVRISLPDLPPRYIFPAMERSFIFIPRALRPNQQGFGRGRGRGSFSGYGAFSSRRTSAHGGSVYSPSVAMSRRSSLAREVSRDGIVSPAGSGSNRMAANTEPGKPVVRLPPAAEQAQGSAQQAMDALNSAPVVNLPLPQSYPLPQKPTFRENRPAPIPMHQPRPQKTVSVADIESPASLSFHPPQQQLEQPFHQQVPTQVNSQIYLPDQPLYPHSRHPSHPSQASGGTPLSQIPESAIHAAPFQPYPYHHPPGFYPPPYVQPMYYYGPPNVVPTLGPSVGGPTFVPGQQFQYAVPVGPPPPPAESTAAVGTVAHESNGMVYYYDSSQLGTGPEGSAPYPPAGYAPPPPGGVVGMGGSPGGFSYQAGGPAVYFPPQ